MLLWRRREPAALLFICGMQWLQGSLKVFYADVLGVELWKLVDAHAIERAAYLTLAWVVMIAAGARLALRGAVHARSVETTRGNYMRMLFVLYASWSAGALALHFLMPDAARQLVLAISNLRWAVVFAIFVFAIRTRRWLMGMWLVFAYEVAIGFLSFFSDFKTPLFLLAIAALAAGQRFSRRQVLGLVMIGAFALYLGVVWSAIKIEYRGRLNEGTGAQGISISRGEQIEELLRLFAAVDGKVLADGFERLVNRLAYIDYFAYTLDYVPAVRPYEGGKLWGASIEHILTPRLLFSDKRVLESDTTVTQRYTGLNFNDEINTSIAIGLPGVTYVDFGPVWMFALALLLGALYGGSYRYFWARAPNDPLAQGFATAVVIQQVSVGTSPPKVLGGEITLILAGVAIWYLLPRVLDLFPTRRAAPVGAVRRG